MASEDETPTDQPGARDSPFDFSNLKIPREEIRDGGPGKDGIPALTDPAVVDLEEVEFLEEGDRVLSVTVGGETRAYPIRLLNWHEIVNDTIGGTPIAAIYCPLCDSASVVDRRIEGKTVEFGVSGLLYNSNVLLYDRRDQGLWSQIGFEAVSGPRAGYVLDHYPWSLETWTQFRESHTEATVATFETDYIRNYETNPYDEYLESDKLKFSPEHTDDRLAPKTRVVGISLGETRRAYPVDLLEKRERIEDEIDGRTVVIGRSRDGSGARILQLPEGARSVHAFWFSWAAFHPDTEIYGSK